MTNTPGDGEQPEDPYRQPQDPYAQPPTAPQYGQPGAGEQPPYGQPYGGQQPYPSYGDQPAYGQPQGFPPTGYTQEHPRATTSLVLGILGLVICGIVAPFAWRMGKRTVDEIDASNGQLTGRGAAQAGYVLGVIGTILLGLALALVLVGIVFVVVIGVSSSNA